VKRACQIRLSHTRVFSPADLLMASRQRNEEEVWEEEIYSEREEDWDEEDDEVLSQDPFSSSAIPDFPPPPTTTLTTAGVFSKEKDGSFRLSYEDSEISGFPGNLNTFCLSPTGMLIFLRRGGAKTCLIFENGARQSCDYGIQSGLPPMTLHTHRLQSNLNENGGTLFVDYSLEMRGSVTEHNTISIQITAEKPTAPQRTPS